MKTAAAFLVMLLSYMSHGQSSPADTVIRGIVIGFQYAPAIFPSDWRTAPINARGEQIEISEIGRSKGVIARALDKYPLTPLQNELRAVYFMKAMNFYSLSYGGTNSSDALYLTNNGIPKGYNDLYLEQTFHHEFSSILLRNHPAFLDTIAWEQNNMTGFQYNDPENGIGAIRNDETSQDLDTALCQKGFLTQYSLSGRENDINTFAQNLFSPSEGFWEIVDNYPRIKRKLQLLIGFYKQVDPLFTEEYFRKLK